MITHSIRNRGLTSKTRSHILSFDGRNKVDDSEAKELEDELRKLLKTENKLKEKEELEKEEEERKRRIAKQRFINLSSFFKSGIWKYLITVLVGRNEREQVCFSKTNSPGVGKYTPKYDSIKAKPATAIIPQLHQKQEKRVKKNSKKRGQRICRRIFRCIDQPDKTELLSIRSNMLGSPYQKKESEVIDQPITSPVRMITSTLVVLYV